MPLPTDDLQVWSPRSGIPPPPGQADVSPSPYAPPQARHAAADPFNFGYQTRQTTYDTRLGTWMHNFIQQLEHESAQREKLLSQPGQALTPEGEQLRQDWMNDRKTIREMQARGYRPQQIAQVMSESLGKFDSRWSDQHVRKQPTPDELFQQHTVIHNGRLYGIGTRNGNVSITALEKGHGGEDFDKEYESAFKLLHGSMPADDAGNRRQPTPEEIEGHIRQKRQLRERMTQGGQQGQGGLAGQGGQPKPDPQQQQQQQQQSPDIWGSIGNAVGSTIQGVQQGMQQGQPQQPVPQPPQQSMQPGQPMPQPQPAGPEPPVVNPHAKMLQDWYNQIPPDTDYQAPDGSWHHKPAQR